MYFIDFLYYMSMTIIIIKMIIHDIKWMRIENHMLLLMLILHVMFLVYNDSFQMVSILESFLMLIFLTILRRTMNTFYQKDTLGFGDIKLLSLITFIMSINTMPYIIFFSSFLTLVGMLVFNLRKIPFAPGILLSWIGVYLWLFI